MPSSEVEHISKEDNETEKEKNVDGRLKYPSGFIKISHQPFSVKELLKIRSKN